jgi:hypothetical protein
VALGPEERRKAKEIMRTRGISYKEALAIMRMAAVVKRAQRNVQRALASESSKPIYERRLKPPPKNLWYNRD